MCTALSNHILVGTNVSCRVGLQQRATGQPSLSWHPEGREHAGMDCCHLVLASDGRHLAESVFQAGAEWAGTLESL